LWLQLFLARKTLLNHGYHGFTQIKTKAMLEKSGQADLPFICHIPSVPIRVIRGEISLSSGFNRRFRV